MWWDILFVRGSCVGVDLAVKIFGNLRKISPVCAGDFFSVWGRFELVDRSSTFPGHLCVVVSCSVVVEWPESLHPLLMGTI